MVIDSYIDVRYANDGTIDLALVDGTTATLTRSAALRMAGSLISSIVKATIWKWKSKGES